MNMAESSDQARRDLEAAIEELHRLAEEIRKNTEDAVNNIGPQRD